jgi:hypothetical protein
LAKQLLWRLSTSAKEGEHMTLTNFLSLARVEEVAENIFQPDTLAVHEYMENYHRKAHLEPEKILMFAILEDAVHCYRAYAFSSSTSSRRLYRDAEKWLWRNDWDWVFSFRNICEALGVDPFFLRRGLLRWKEAQTGADAITKRRVCLPRHGAA